MVSHANHLQKYVTNTKKKTWVDTIPTQGLDQTCLFAIPY